jgi:hypothetical protein
LRVFALAGTLITAAIIAVLAVMYLNAATAPATNMPRVETPYGTVGGTENPGNIIDTARGIASMDKNRTQEMQNMLDGTSGAGTGP